MLCYYQPVIRRLLVYHPTEINKRRSHDRLPRRRAFSFSAHTQDVLVHAAAGQVALLCSRHESEEKANHNNPGDCPAVSCPMQNATTSWSSSPESFPSGKLGGSPRRIYDKIAPSPPGPLVDAPQSQRLEMQHIIPVRPRNQRKPMKRTSESAAVAYRRNRKKKMVLSEAPFCNDC